VAPRLVGRRLFLRSVGGSLAAVSFAAARAFDGRSLQAAAVGRADRADLYSGSIIVRLSESLTSAAEAADFADLRELAATAESSALQAVLRDFPQAPATRISGVLGRAQVEAIERRLGRQHVPSVKFLRQFWRIDATRVRERGELLQCLSRLPVVELAYQELNVREPAVDAANDPHAVLQSYLDAAPVGIDARWAWSQPNGSGQGVGFVDVEQGWLIAFASDPNSVQHEDLPTAVQFQGVPREVNPAICPPSRHHGTAVLGVVSGADNDKGIVGIAPSVSWVDVASHYQNGTRGHVAEAMASVLPHMAAGDVLLLEVQDALNRPIETDPAVRECIDLAAALGVIVVEPAGNGGVDLDAVPELNRSTANTDSGAIIVGAGESQLDSAAIGHDRWVMTPSDFQLPGPIPSFLPDCGYGMVPPPPLPASNYGSRVDCYAWGDNIVSTGYGWLGGTTATDSYTNRFGGTSAAAAIVAGAVVVLQGLHKAAKGVPLSPAVLREALVSNGTPQGTGVTGHIGTMPDLKRAAMALSLTPAVPSPPTNLRSVP